MKRFIDSLISKRVFKLIGIKDLLIAVLLLVVVGCNTTPKLYLVGDSTMADKEKLYLPERGWGQLLPELFVDELFIQNHAKNGRSTRSFIYEGRWDSVCAKLNGGDYIIIQFGHNDGSEKKTERYATPIEYEYNLRKFISDVKEKNANPILATPVVRRRFDDNNSFYDTHGVYPDIVRKVSNDLIIPLLEMHGASMHFIKELGAVESKAVYLHIEGGINDSLPNGKIDNTHFSEYGALEIAKLAAQEIKQKVPELAKYLK